MWFISHTLSISYARWKLMKPEMRERKKKSSQEIGMGISYIMQILGSPVPGTHILFDTASTPGRASYINLCTCTSVLSVRRAQTATRPPAHLSPHFRSPSPVLTVVSSLSSRAQAVGSRPKSVYQCIWVISWRDLPNRFLITHVKSW